MKLYNSKYFHRDLSWLRFNHRVLQEASDKNNPLYERIKFLAIFSSNLDEFFSVRVSDIRQIKTLKKPLRKKLITKPNKVLKEIKRQVDIQQEEFGEIFRNQIIPELRNEGIHLINYKDYNLSQQVEARAYFDNQLRPKLNFEQCYYSEPNSFFVEHGASYLASQTPKGLHIVKIPSTEPRFFTFQNEEDHFYMSFVDDILKFVLQTDTTSQSPYYAIKVSRDAELYIEDEYSGDIMKKIQESLSNRQKGQPTRLLVDKTMPVECQELLKEVLDVSVADVVQGGTYHNFKDFFGFPNPSQKRQLHFEEFAALSHPELNNTDSIFDMIDEKDQLVHYPYQSFEPVIQLIESAAKDPSVKTVKLTLYRLASDSRLNRAIAEAAKNGKNVVVFIELKARFDEENNIKWSRIFSECGATVIHSFADFKVHSKIIYIEREIDNDIKSYAFISTGNFNEKTSKIYSDFGLMTSHKTITKDLNMVFMVLENRTLIPRTKRLLVSPFTTRPAFEKLVRAEMKNALEGKDSYIILKMNSLQDKEMIDLLYQANNAGVKIELIIRGICCLVPGIKDQSENIKVVSILDRYLEHSRIYIFGNAGEELIYMGSADWMTRNLDHRIEVLTPILDKEIQNTVKELVALQLSDNLKARVIDSGQNNLYVKNDLFPIRSQFATYDYFGQKVLNQSINQ